MSDLYYDLTRFPRQAPELLVGLAEAIELAYLGIVSPPGFVLCAVSVAGATADKDGALFKGYGGKPERPGP